jgi:DNA-directed RNA polymerase II subunit RPB1
MSVCQIEEIQITNPEGNPSRGGINDLRMGTVDKSLNCETCGSNFADCPGHFGHIELVKPVFHVGFIEVCRKILRCICFNCSKLLAQKDSKYNEAIKNKNPKKRQNLMYNICKGIKECKMKNEKHYVNFVINLFLNGFFK